jgi:hypothetical protein
MLLMCILPQGLEVPSKELRNITKFDTKACLDASHQLTIMKSLYIESMAPADESTLELAATEKWTAASL